MLMMGSILVLIVEYSLARRIRGDDLVLNPSELWEEIRRKNPQMKRGGYDPY